MIDSCSERTKSRQSQALRITDPWNNVPPPWETKIQICDLLIFYIIVYIYRLYIKSNLLPVCILICIYIYFWILISEYILKICEILKTETHLLKAKSEERQDVQWTRQRYRN